MTAAAVAVRERPIPFSGPMARAAHRFQKTQTRRVVLPQPEWLAEVRSTITNNSPFAWPIGALGQQCGAPLPLKYAVGDRLWVKEAYRLGANLDALAPSLIPPGQLGRIAFEADGEERIPWANRGRYRHGRFMPRRFSRTMLELTAVRVERVQDISEADAIAEGMDARLLADALAPLAARANAKPLHWIGGTDNDAENYCLRCAEKRVRQLAREGEGDAFVDGGFGGEEDREARCVSCGDLLDCSLTDYGVLEELAGAEAFGINSPADAHTVRTLLNAGGNPLLTETCGEFAYHPEWKGRVARLCFRTIWDELNAARGYGWDANPLVWVLSFERVRA